MPKCNLLKFNRLHFFLVWILVCKYNSVTQNYIVLFSVNKVVFI